MMLLLLDTIMIDYYSNNIYYTITIMIYYSNDINYYTMI